MNGRRLAASVSSALCAAMACGLVMVGWKAAAIGWAVAALWAGLCALEGE